MKKLIALTILILALVPCVKAADPVITISVSQTITGDRAVFIAEGLAKVNEAETVQALVDKVVEKLLTRLTDEGLSVAAKAETQEQKILRLKDKARAVRVIRLEALVVKAAPIVVEKQ